MSLTGTPVVYSNFGHTFRQAVTPQAWEPTGRHGRVCMTSGTAFAVRTLVGWYRAGLDVEALLPRLSTYLGHREPRFTYHYLTATPELLGHAAARLEAAQQVTR